VVDFERRIALIPVINWSPGGGDGTQLGVPNGTPEVGMAVEAGSERESSNVPSGEVESVERGLQG